MAKNPKERLTEIQDTQAQYLEAKVVAKSESNDKELRFWLPSGATAKIPKHEVLMLRDVCNDFMARHGAVDIMGREVADWGRPHPEIEPLGRPDTEPADKGQPNAAQ